MNAVLNLGNELPSLGLHPGMTEEEYRRAPGINQSFLSDVAVSPAFAQWRRKHPKPQTDAMAIGSAFHCLLLEPDAFPKRFIKSAFPNFKTKAAQEWRDAQVAAGFTVLRTTSDDPEADPSEWDRPHLMRDAVMAHPYASALLNDEGPTECPMFWIDPHSNRLCKGKLDKWCAGHRVIADVKKTRGEGAGMSAFARSVHEYRYHVQARFYLDGMYACKLLPRAFVFIVVEEDPPFQIGCYTLPAEWLEQARAQYERDLHVVSQCMKADEWPSYPPEIREVAMPAFAKFTPIT